MLDIKRRIKTLKVRIIKWWIRVPFDIHEKALNTILTMEETITQLERRNDILERKVTALEKDIEYRENERKIDQSMIAELLADVLKYTEVPKSKLKALEKKVDKMKSKARKNYGR